MFECLNILTNLILLVHSNRFLLTFIRNYYSCQKHCSSLDFHCLIFVFNFYSPLLLDKYNLIQKVLSTNFTFCVIGQAISIKQYLSNLNIYILELWLYYDVSSVLN